MFKNTGRIYKVMSLLAKNIDFDIKMKCEQEIVYTNLKLTEVDCEWLAFELPWLRIVANKIKVDIVHNTRHNDTAKVWKATIAHVLLNWELMANSSGSNFSNCFIDNFSDQITFFHHRNYIEKNCFWVQSQILVNAYLKSVFKKLTSLTTPMNWRV
jgi:hypothetical protein